MNKFLSVLFLFLVLIGYANNDLSSLSGNWIDKETGFVKINFTNSENKIWMETSEGKFKINRSMKGDFVNINNKEYLIVLNSEQKELLVGSKTYIPENLGIKKQFLGIWKNNDKNILFEISEVNGGIYWDIFEEENKVNRFYPKLTKEGFTFTYGEEQLFFTIKNNYILDSKGVKYYIESKS